MATERPAPERRRRGGGVVQLALLLLGGVLILTGNLPLQIAGVALLVVQFATPFFLLTPAPKPVADSSPQRQDAAVAALTPEQSEIARAVHQQLVDQFAGTFADAFEEFKRRAADPSSSPASTIQNNGGSSRG